MQLLSGRVLFNWIRFELSKVVHIAITIQFPYIGLAVRFEFLCIREQSLCAFTHIFRYALGQEHPAKDTYHYQIRVWQPC